MEYSKKQLTKCPHGKIYWVRWQWDESKGETIEDSVPDFSVNGCKECEK